MEKKQRQKEPTEKEFMQNPSLWPRWPILPVKRSKDRKHGVLAEFGMPDRPEIKPIIYLANLFDLSDKVTDFSKLPKLEYDTFDDLINDGWVVD